MSTNSLKETRETYGKVVNELRDLSVRVAKEKEGIYTPEDKQVFERLNNERVRLENLIESAEIDNQIAGIANTTREKIEREVAKPQYKGEDFYRQDADKAMKAWLLRGKGVVPDSFSNAAQRLGVDLTRNELSCQMTPSKPVWQKRTGANEGTNSLGGYTVLPHLIANDIDVALKQYCSFRDVCRVYPTATGGQPLLYPTVNDTSVLAVSHTENNSDMEQDWTLAQVSVPTCTNFSTGIFPISVELVQDSVIPVTEVIAELCGVRIGRSMASSFTTTLLSDVTTSVTSGSAGTVTYADIQSLLWTPDLAYINLPSIALMCSQDFIRNAYSLVDSNNRPLMNMSVDAIGHQYQTLLGYRLVPNNYLGTVAATNTVAVFGPWEKAIVRDAGPLNMKVLNERFMDELAIGLVAWQRSSFKTLRPAAFAKLVVHS